jgi:hypothetical protein
VKRDVIEPGQEQEDEALLRAFEKSGSEAAFRELVRRHPGMVLGQALEIMTQANAKAVAAVLLPRSIRRRPLDCGERWATVSHWKPPSPRPPPNWLRMFRLKPWIGCNHFPESPLFCYFGGILC